jgi:ATP-dependent DNA helicase RecG
MYAGELRDKPVAGQKFVTERQAGFLGKLGIATLYDALMYFPFRYEDRSRVETIADSLAGDRAVTVIARVTAHQSIYFNNRKHPKIVIEDGVSRALLVGFNRPYLEKSLVIGKTYWVNAHFVYKFNEVQTASFDFEEFHEGEIPKSFGQVLPVYRVTEAFTVKEMRAVMKKILDAVLPKLDDELPGYVRAAQHLEDKRDAMRAIHFPPDEEALAKAKRRLAYEEFLAIQLAVGMKRRNRLETPKHASYPASAKVAQFLSGLPFRPTKAQLRSMDEIFVDMESLRAMHRLLQGDVGSGKTTVALAAMVRAAENGFQAALMAPTEVLAAQHYRTFSPFAERLRIPFALLTGSTPKPERMNILEGLADGSIQAIVGTHALLTDDVAFLKLGLCVFDEQHKFGVEQRIALSKKGDNPDILVMTATPIPRTLTLTLYGDLDVSIIDELPAGRIPVVTKWTTREKYPAVLDFVERQAGIGRQIYFIAPLVEEGKTDAENAVKLHAKLTRRFQSLRVGLIHGRMTPAQKDEAMESFRKGETHVLVSTTVIEVGVDVRNASMMVIEDADRFGLSQLHQLRGRVGRGEHKSWCVLVTDDDGSGDPDSGMKSRMEALVRTSDGFEIAEEDLRQRGPGEILGVRQSGLPELKVADAMRDEKLLLETRRAAAEILRDDRTLSKEENRPLFDGVIRFLPKDYLHSG